jgi:predicted phage terminase large subunit-like protein
MTETVTRADLAERFRLHNWSPYIPHQPQPKQHIFLLARQREVLYGGQVGGGKSDGLLMGALQDVEVPGYSALLLRRRYTDLVKAGALIYRSHQWLDPTDATFNQQQKQWTFPSGSTVEFGYITNDADLEQYQSAEYQYVGFDELTQFTLHQYTYMMSRVRRVVGVDAPLRIRAGTNPGGPGHEWVKSRFRLGSKHRTDPIPAKRLFIPAGLDDNRYLRKDEYEEGLSNLRSVTRQQLLHGDWDVNEEGTKFKRSWFPIVDATPTGLRLARYWDLASTEKDRSRESHDPDFTVGALVGISNDGTIYILDIVRDRTTPQGVDRMVSTTAARDGREVPIWMEQEPGASGVRTIDYFRRSVLQGFAFRPDKVSGSKELRANPLSSQAEAGNVVIVRGAWNEDWLAEAESFPIGEHDDQVDAVSGAYQMLTKHREWKVG